MFFLILGIVLILASIFLIKTGDNFFSLEITGAILSAFGAFSLMLFMTGFVHTPIKADMNIISYEIDKDIISQIHKSSTSEEKREALQIIRNNNKIISHARAYYDNFFIGIFYSKRIADLELLQSYNKE